MKATFLFFLIIPNLISSQINLDEKFSVYGCLKHKEKIYIKQTEVSIKDWISYVYHKNKDTYSENEFNFISYEGKELLSFFPKGFDISNKYIFDIVVRSIHLYNASDIMFGGSNQSTKEISRKDYKKKWISSCIKPFPIYINKKNSKDTLIDVVFKMDFPITGLTHKQVEEFLLWQENMLNSFLSNDDNFLHKVKLIPIETYDTLISDIKKDFKIKDENNKNKVIGDSVNQKGCQIYNFKGGEYCPNSEQFLQLFGEIDSPVRVHDYFPRSNGMYNILGNVAEMTSSEGIAVGGHYEMYANEILKNEKIYFKKPSKKIGFRFMVSLIERTR